MARSRPNGAVYPIPYKTRKKLKDGTIRVYEGYHAKVEGKWVSAKGYDECRRKIREALGEARQWGAISDRTVKLGAYAWEWYEGHKTLLDPNSRKNYVWVLRCHLDQYANLRIADITPSVIRRMVNSMRRKDGSEASLNSKKCMHRVLHMIFKTAVADRIIPTNPMDSVESPRAKDIEPTRRHEAFTDEQVKRMLEESSADLRSGMIDWWRLMTGMRQGEVLGATWDELTLLPANEDQSLWHGYYRVHWKLEKVNRIHGCGNPNKQNVYPCGYRFGYKCPQASWDIPVGFDMKLLTGGICLTPPKSQRDRIVPIPVPLGTALHRYRELTKSEPNPYNLIFHNPDGTIVDTVADMKHFRDLMRRAGVPNPESRIRHECRNTVVSRLFSEGMDPGKIQRIIGHSSLAMAEYYRRVPKEELLDGMERLYADVDVRRVEAS